MKGIMRWKDTLIPVSDVVYSPRIDDEGVRGGWNATIDDSLGGRMFYPEDMFSFIKS